MNQMEAFNCCQKESTLILFIGIENQYIYFIGQCTVCYSLIKIFSSTVHITKYYKIKSTSGLF